MITTSTLLGPLTRRRMRAVKLAGRSVKVPSRKLISPGKAAEIARDDSSPRTTDDSGALRAAGQLRHVPGRRHGGGRAARPPAGHRGADRLRDDRLRDLLRR